jgi:hypothetical protein
MALGGRMAVTVDYKAFERRLEVAVSRVQRGTKKATRQACEDIKEISVPMVPTETGTLANTFFYEIEGAYRNFTATLGYGGPNDLTNPKTGQPASQYMIAVHEDLSAVHPHGQAKFLEDAVKQYQARFLSRAAQDISGELL